MKRPYEPPDWNWVEVAAEEEEPVPMDDWGGKRGEFQLVKHKRTLNSGVKAYLDDGRVLRERACWFGWFAHSQILDVAASEDDVLKDVISG